MTVLITVFFIYKYNMYYTYILLTENDTLYCGYTDNVEKRFQKHLSGKGAKYTRANKPVKIVYQHSYRTKSEALREEARIKKLTKKEKLKLIARYSRFRLLLFVFPAILILFHLAFQIIAVF